MQRILLFLSVFFILNSSIAQSIPENFQKAKNELSSKDYWTAINSFKPFLDFEKYGNLANYAAFHTAEAYLLVNQPGQAIEVLRPAYSRNWNKSDELKYLLALGYFQNGQTVDALRIVQQIKNQEVLEKAYNASYEFASKTSPSFLVTNLEEFKTNEGYTAALAFVLQSKSIMTAGEREALKMISESGKNPVIAKDEILDIVVIFPFTSGSSAVSGMASNDFLFELYQGIEMGVEDLKRQGVKVTLQSFDSKRDLKVLSSLLQDPAVNNADVIIGPIYPDESVMVSEFAEAEKIPFIHPLSNLGERFEQLKYSYLFRPSAVTLTKNTVSSLKKQGWGREVAIGYSGTSRDEKMAQDLAAEFAKEGFTVVKNERIDQRSVNSFLQGLGISRGGSAKVDQVILLTDDPAIAQPTFALMESITASVPVVVMDSWLTFNFANFEMLEFPNFYFISNNTLNFGTEEMKQFKNRFYEKYLAYPSLNTLLGSELVYWVSSNTDLKNGLSFRNSLDQNSFQNGRFTFGFNFRNSNNNLYSPILKLENGELIPLN
ncbi:ABC transporter substrate-binding protein [Algoriphagus boseongensis]|nr:ABC transporter substrate-binding protein [Algoriphagus boseongensis]